LALRANDAARELVEALAGTTLLGHCLLTRGDIDLDQSKVDAATEDYEKAQDAFRSAGDRTGEARAAYGLGKVMLRAGKYGEARPKFEASLATAREFQDKPLEAMCLNGLGELTRRQSDFPQALTNLQACLDIDLSLSNRLGIVEDQGNLANVYMALGDVSSALRFYQASLGGYRELGDRQGEGMILGDLGALKEMTGDFSGALADDNASLEIKRQIGDQEGITMGLNNIGDVYLGSGQPTAALSWFLESERSALTNKDQAGLAQARHNIGAVYCSLGDYEAAMRWLKDSLDIERQLQNRGGIAQTRGQLATLLEDSGLHAEARAEFEALLQEFRAAGMKYEGAETLHNLASVEAAQEDFDAARRHLAESLSLKQQLLDLPGQAATLAGLGDVELKALRLDEAAARYQEALQLADSIGAYGNSTLALLGLGEVELARQRPASALGWFQKALERAQAAGGYQMQAQALTGIGRAQHALKRLSAAVSSLQQAVALIERARGTLRDPSEAAGFLSRHTQPYEELTRCLGESGEIGAAWQTVEKARARTLMEMLGRAGVPVAKAMTAEERLRHQALEEQLTFATRDYMTIQWRVAATPDQVATARKYFAGPSGASGSLGASSFYCSAALWPTNPGPEQVASARARLDAVRRDYDAFRRSLYSNHPEAAGQRGEATPPALDQLKPLLNESRLAILEFLVGEEVSELFVIRAGGDTNAPPRIAAFDLPAGREEIGRLARRVRNLLAGQSLRWPIPEAVRLHRLLLGPAAALLEDGAVLCIVPDGPLWEIPFSALCDDRGGAVIDQHAVFYAPSIGSLLAMRQLADLRAREPRPSVAHEARLMAMANPSLGPSRKVDNPTLGAFDEIPGTARQARELASLYGQDAVVFQGPEATEHRAKLECGHHRFLHFATHGVFDPASPMHSGILLTAGEGEDGFLEAREIMDLDWQAELVVLSACDTARGQEQPGEGIWGLSWALFVAGSPSNLLTLWPVADESTADFVAAFYRNLRANAQRAGSAVSKAQALRQAQLTLKKDERYGHPFYWAPFVLIGDWR
jgi:CHAT domain-containing protein/tetratricopeptide (TPR) repeat protein